MTLTDAVLMLQDRESLNRVAASCGVDAVFGVTAFPLPRVNCVNFGNEADAVVFNTAFLDMRLTDHAWMVKQDVGFYGALVQDAHRMLIERLLRSLASQGSLLVTKEE